MTTLSRPTVFQPDVGLELHTGDRMNREEFHRAYELTPDGFKAELIGGIVYVASRVTRKHGTLHISLGSILFFYKVATPGVEAGDNVTVQLGYDAEPQPDLFLRILPEYGGKSRHSEGGDYVEVLRSLSPKSRSAAGPLIFMPSVTTTCAMASWNTWSSVFARVNCDGLICGKIGNCRWAMIESAGRERFPACGLMPMPCLPETTLDCYKPFNAAWRRPNMPNS